MLSEWIRKGKSRERDSKERENLKEAKREVMKQQKRAQYKYESDDE